jgi:hypothetical protein
VEEGIESGMARGGAELEAVPGVRCLSTWYAQLGGQLGCSVAK